MTIDNVLDERKKTHGDYSEHARCTQRLLRAMQDEKNWPHYLTDCQVETLHMIAHKLGRIMTGDPNVEDHWLDIAGYAQLIVRELQKTRTIASDYRPGTPEDGGHHARQECDHLYMYSRVYGTSTCARCGQMRVGEVTDDA